MSAYLKNSCFIHIPKTGGRWIREMILQFIDHDEVMFGDPWIAPDGKRHHLVPHPVLDSYNKIPFYFVREPSEWISSLWPTLSSTYTKWHLRDDVFGVGCEDNFGQFVDNICKQNNWVMRVYSYWVKHLKNPIIGKQENLVADFLSILNQCKETYNISSIISCSHQKFDSKTYNKQIFTLEQKEKIFDANDEFYDKFNYLK